MLISFSLLLDGPETTVQFKSFCQIEIPQTALIKILIEPLTIFSFCRCMSPQVACSYSDLLKISIAWVETVTGGWAPTISTQSMSKGGRIPSNFLRSPTIGVWPSKCLDIFPPLMSLRFIQSQWLTWRPRSTQVFWFAIDLRSFLPDGRSYSNFRKMNFVLALSSTNPLASC